MKAGLCGAALLLLAAAARAETPGTVSMTSEQQHTIGLQTAVATRQPITEPVRLPGTIAFDPGHVAAVRPFEQARVERLLVEPGQTVAAGQALAELQMPGLASLQADLTASEAALREAGAAVAVARAALERAVILSRDGSMARAEADRRRLVLAQALAGQDAVRAKAAALRQAIARLDPAPGGGGLATLRAPIAGIVVATGIAPGEITGPAGAAITVADLSVVTVLAQVPENQARQVEVGEAAQIETPEGGGSWEGHVETLGAELDPRSRTLPARIRLPNPALALRAGMFVSVVVTDSLHRESVVVPSAAVQRVADKRVVFTPEGGDRFQSHDVKTGVERQNSVEIRSGLAAGATVVTRGSFDLKALLTKQMLGGG